MLGIALTLSPAHASAREAPRPVIEKMVHDAFVVLRDDTLRQHAKERLRALRAIVDRAFDWDAMAKSSLGAPWRSLNEQQRKEFVGVFKELLAQRYMDDIDRFQGNEQLTIAGSEETGELATVKTLLLTSSREQVPIDYTLRAAVGEAPWRVEDVSIEGVSLVNHYRKTFAQYLASKSFGELMQLLTRKLGSAEKPASN